MYYNIPPCFWISFNNDFTKFFPSGLVFKVALVMTLYSIKCASFVTTFLNACYHILFVEAFYDADNSDFKLLVLKACNNYVAKTGFNIPVFTALPG